MDGHRWLKRLKEQVTAALWMQAFLGRETRVAVYTFENALISTFALLVLGGARSGWVTLSMGVNLGHESIPIYLVLVLAAIAIVQMVSRLVCVRYFL